MCVRAHLFSLCLVFIFISPHKEAWLSVTEEELEYAIICLSYIKHKARLPHISFPWIYQLFLFIFLLYANLSVESMKNDRNSIIIKSGKKTDDNLIFFLF